MEQSTSKLIGRLIQIAGILLIIIGLATKSPEFGGLGAIIAFIGRLIEAYWPS